LNLPSVDTIREAFGMEDWSRSKVSFSSWGEEEDNLPSYGGANNDDVTIQQIIHRKLQGQISHSGPLNAYFEMRRREDSYELWTKDYVFGLAQYLLDRIAEMDRHAASSSTQSTPPTETIILDVGAGDGRLVFFLRKAMKEIRASNPPEQQSLPTIIATDDGSWKAPIYNNHHIQVEQLSAIQALDKYGPKTVTQKEGDAKTSSRLIVLCSWMPPGHDWTVDFRRPVDDAIGATGDESGDGGGVERVVDEYILVGEADDGTCGHNWYTWGNQDFASEHDEDEKPKDAPYVLDGYKRVDLGELSNLQFSRFDCKRSSESKTVSFRRGQNN